MRTAEDEQKEKEDGELLVSMMGDDLDPAVAQRVLRKYNGDLQRAAEAILSGERAEETYWPASSGSEQTIPTSSSVIDLTGEDEYRQGRPLTREKSESSATRTRAEPPTNRTIKFAPTDRAPDPNWQLVPANVNPVRRSLFHSNCYAGSQLTSFNVVDFRLRLRWGRMTNR